MKYRKTARPLALLVASILALQPVSALAVTFADINQVPWPGAETSINKAADLGLVVGETINGKSYFRPKDSVSLSESCQFTYKVLLQTKKITADSSVTEKWKNVLNTYQIQDWAHPAVSFCLENGIISIADLSSYVKNGMNVAATREQAAEMLGRALTVGAPSYSATASNTKFNDNANIATDARPYIALLNEAGIVNGDDLKNFNPKKTLNRTETAVMVTNLYSKLNSVTTTPATTVSSSVSGTVTDMNSLYVNLDGRAAYYLYSSSGVTATLNGSSSSIDALVTLYKEGTAMKATLTLDGNTRI
ncbi:MAG: S-layer homology domain-containing protein, partial [Anaerotignum sp.]|nr:S-layer homology domain-containing protein [Anaerotignum sp.]